MAMVTSRRLTRRSWASRQNYRADLLAIGKDSNVIGVRSSCLKRRRSDRKKGPRAQTRWKTRAQPRWKTRAQLPALNKTNTPSTNQQDAMRTRKDECMMDALRMHTEHGKYHSSKTPQNMITI